jgi:DNA-binding IclR family transcriptional regulator
MVDASQRLKTVETTLSLIDALRELDGARVSEVARHLNLAKSTTHRHLSTLRQCGFVVKDGDVYHISLRFLDLGEYTRYSREEYRLAKRLVEELADETEERCQFVVEERGRAIYVHVAAGAHGDETDARVGKHMFLHSTSAGKSILAHLPRNHVEAIVEEWGLPRQTPHTITTKERLFEVLEEVRARGYAFNRGGNVDGLRAVGAPVLGGDGDLIGAISISGPTHRMRGERFEERLPRTLVERTEELRTALQ